MTLKILMFMYKLCKSLLAQLFVYDQLFSLANPSCLPCAHISKKFLFIREYMNYFGLS